MTCSVRCFKPPRCRGSWAGGTFLPARPCAVIVRDDGGGVRTLYSFAGSVPMAWVDAVIEATHPGCSYTLEPAPQPGPEPTCWTLSA